RRDHTDGQVDAAGQHAQRLAGCEDRERDGGPDRDPDPICGDSPRSGELHQHDQDHEQPGQRDERTVAEEPAQPLSVGQRATGGDDLGLGAHARTRRIVRRLPNMTTPIRIAPWMTVERLELAPSRVRSVRTRASTNTATIGPATPPLPPARLTPPRTIAATPSSV